MNAMFTSVNQGRSFAKALCALVLLCSTYSTIALGSGKLTHAQNGPPPPQQDSQNDNRSIQSIIVDSDEGRPIADQAIHALGAGVFPPDERIRIEDTTASWFPWRAIVDLDIEFPSGKRDSCTGFFIHPRVVATAAHCIYANDGNARRFPAYIRVIPGRNSGYLPYGSSTVTSSSSFRIPPQWLSSPNPEYDYGAIVLPDDSLGNRVGLWFRIAIIDDQGLSGLPVDIAGYPKDKSEDDLACPWAARDFLFSACQLWVDTDPIIRTFPRIVSFAIDLDHGQSGAPVFHFDGRWNVVAIATNAFRTPICQGLNCGTRINSAVAQDFLNWSGFGTPLLNLRLSHGIHNYLKSRQVTLEFHPPGHINRRPPIYTISGTTDANGNVSFVLTGLAPDTYDILIKPRAWLRRQISNVRLGPGINDLSKTDYCCAGDIVINNRNDIFDYSVFVQDFRDKNLRSDLNGDGLVDIFDYALLVSDFGISGDGGEITSSGDVLQTNDTNIAQGQLILSPSPLQTRTVGDAQPNTIAAGEVFTLTLSYDSAGVPMSGVETYIDYDHCVLELLRDRITHSGVFSTTAVFSRAGTVDYLAHKWTGTNPGLPVTGTGYLANIPFRVIAGLPISTSVSLRFQPGSTFESDMVDDVANQDVLGNVTNFVFQPTGIPQRPLRTTQLISPASRGVINQHFVLLEALANDPCGGIQQMVFSVFTTDPQGLGTVTTLAGSAGRYGSSDGIGPAARFNIPFGIAVSPDDRFALIADVFNNAVRRLDLTTLEVTTFSSQFNYPQGVAITSAADFAIVADTGSHTIMRINLATREVSTIAGSAGNPGSADGIGSSARFQAPYGVSLSADSSFAIVADTINSTIRRVDLATGQVTTIAGSAGERGSADGVGSEARFFSPYGVAVSADGTYVLVADTVNDTIRRVDLSTRTVTTISGSAGQHGSADGIGTAARFWSPGGISLSADGRFALIVDSANFTVRRLELATGRVTTIAGRVGTGGNVDGAGSNARFTEPYGIALSAGGTFALVSDTANYTIRRIDLGQWSVIGTDSNSSDGWSLLWDASSIPDQVIALRSFAGDLAGNGVMSPVNGYILLDRQAPTVTSFAVQPITTVSPTPVTITAHLSDNLAGMSSNRLTQVYVGSQAALQGEASWDIVGLISGTGGNVIWNTNGFAPGSYRVALDMADAAGNQAVWLWPGAFQLGYQVYMPTVLRNLNP